MTLREEAFFQKQMTNPSELIVYNRPVRHKEGSILSSILE